MLSFSLAHFFWGSFELGKFLSLGKLSVAKLTKLEPIVEFGKFWVWEKSSDKSQRPVCEAYRLILFLFLCQWYLTNKIVIIHEVNFYASDTWQTGSWLYTKWTSMPVIPDKRDRDYTRSERTPSISERQTRTHDIRMPRNCFSFFVCHLLT